MWLERGADLQTMAKLMPLPLTVSCFSKIQIGFTFLVLAYPGSPGKRAVKWARVCVCNLQDGGKINWHRYRTKLRRCHPMYDDTGGGVSAGVSSSPGM